MTRERMEEIISVAAMLACAAAVLSWCEVHETREVMRKTVRVYTTDLFRLCGLEGR